VVFFCVLTDATIHHNVFNSVFIDNHASQKLLISAGYEKEGIMRNKVTREERGQIDMALFAATDSTWGR
jgi:RimJ/RimL family protein N-acetyltransferase